MTFLSLDEQLIISALCCRTPTERFAWKVFATWLLIFVICLIWRERSIRIKSVLKWQKGFQKEQCPEKRLQQNGIWLHFPTGNAHEFWSVSSSVSGDVFPPDRNIWRRVCQRIYIQQLSPGSCQSMPDICPHYAPSHTPPWHTLSFIHAHSTTDTQSETGLFHQRATVASVSDADSAEC